MDMMVGMMVSMVFTTTCTTHFMGMAMPDIPMGDIRIVDEAAEAMAAVDVGGS